jgi:hypothetical protein
VYRYIDAAGAEHRADVLAFTDAVRNGTITEGTPVHSEQLGRWLPAGQLSAFHIAQSPPRHQTGAGRWTPDGSARSAHGVAVAAPARPGGVGPKPSGHRSPTDPWRSNGVQQMHSQAPDSHSRTSLARWMRLAPLLPRATRTSFAFWLGLSTVLGTLLVMASNPLAFGLIAIYSSVSFIATIGAAVGRLHDTGKPGWWLVLAVVPVANVVLLLHLLLAAPRADINRFGPAAWRATGETSPPPVRPDPVGRSAYPIGSHRRRANGAQQERV